MPTTRILGPDGNPIRVSTERPRITADAFAVGNRPSQYAPVAPGMNPARLARVLCQGAEGELQDALTLYEEMEEKDLHYFGQLRTRKLNILCREISVEPVDDDSEAAAEVASECQASLIRSKAFRWMLFDLLDALGKGFSVVEPVWTVRDGLWTLKTGHHIDGRWCKFDDETLRELRFIDHETPEGRPIPEGEFLIHYARQKSGSPARDGLGRLAAIVWMLKNYNVKDWAALAEVFGMPIRIGRYTGENVQEQTLAMYRSVLAALGSDAAALIPEGLDIEIMEGRTSRGGGSGVGSGGVHDAFIRWCDEQMSKGILGQTMTADNGSSRSQGEVHERVAQVITEFDAFNLESTVQPLIDLWSRFNRPGVALRLAIQTDPPEDLKIFTESLTPWVAMGLEVSKAQLRAKFGLEAPETPEDILGAPPRPAPDDSQADPQDPPQRGPQAAPNAVEDRVEALLNRPELAQPWETQLILAASNSETQDEFRQAVRSITDTNAIPFIDALAGEMFRLRADPND